MNALRKRRIAGNLEGDCAIDADNMIVSMGIDGISNSKAETDQMLLQLAIASLDSCYKQCGAELGIKYPSYHQLLSFLGNGCKVENICNSPSSSQSILDTETNVA